MQFSPTRHKNVEESKHNNNKNNERKKNTICLCYNEYGNYA